MKIQVLEWNAWDEFLISHIFPEELRLKVEPFCNFEQKISRPILCQINLTDLTELPINVDGLISMCNKKGVKFFNQKLLNISKKVVQYELSKFGVESLRIEKKESDFDVIIKSDLNWGGEFERRNIDSCSHFQGKIPPHGFGPENYSVMKIQDVPLSVFSDERFTVERFISNSEDVFFRCYIGGENMIVVKAYAQGPIKKLSGTERDINYVVTLNELETVGLPEQFPVSLRKTILTAIQAFDIDYAAIDIVLDDKGNSFVVDINVTPWCGSTPPQQELCDFLKHGILMKLS